MTEELLLTLLISLCSKTNDLNFSYKDNMRAKLTCMAKMTECATDKTTNFSSFLSLKDFMKKCSKENK